MDFCVSKEVVCMPFLKHPYFLTGSKLDRVWSSTEMLSLNCQVQLQNRRDYGFNHPKIFIYQPSSNTTPPCLNGACIPTFSALLEHMVRLTSAMHHQVAVGQLGMGHFEKVAQVSSTILPYHSLLGDHPIMWIK